MRYIGCSNLKAWQVVEARWTSRSLGLAPFVSCQNEYSLLMRQRGSGADPDDAGLWHGLLPYYPLASGALTGKYRRNTPMPEGARLTVHGARYGDRFLNDANWPIVERLEAFAEAARPDAAGTRVQLARGAAMRIQHHRRRDEARAGGGERSCRGLGAIDRGPARDRSDHATPVTSLASPDSRRARIASSQWRPSNGFARTARIDIHAIQATHVDADAIRRGPRRIERMDAAVLAEGMLGDAAAELVGGDRILTAQQLEPIARHNKVQDSPSSCRSSNCTRIRWSRSPWTAEPHLAAMAAALIGL